MSTGDHEHSMDGINLKSSIVGDIILGSYFILTGVSSKVPDDVLDGLEKN